MENNMPTVPYEVIKKAVNKDEAALKYVLDIFTPYINKLATRGYYDEIGRYHKELNEDLASYIQSRLILDIIHNFKILSEAE